MLPSAMPQQITTPSMSVEEFYSRLSTVIQSCPRFTIMMGDFNAKNGYESRREIMRQHGLREMNYSGKRFNQCALNRLVIGGSVLCPVNREPNGPFMHREEV